VLTYRMNNSQSISCARACKGCCGSGRYRREGFVSSYDGVLVPAVDRPCSSCDGKGSFMPPDEETIFTAIKGRKGLKSKKPEGNREWYVWRMARFWSGLDVTMPICAMGAVSDDPFKDELTKFSEHAAVRFVGNSVAAVNRWGRLFGLVDPNAPQPAGLAATAYECGPVLHGVQKPDCEMGELA
jgi:hypothetical protein